MFNPASDSSRKEFESRKSMATRLGSFGVDFLDEALRGIFPDDLILLGAPSGVGKTELCCIVSLANMANGKKVHYIALEAGEYEIERRMKYPLVLERYYADPNRPHLGKIEYTDWLIGKYSQQLEKYELEAAEFFEKAYKDLFLFYKQDKFGLDELIRSVCYVAAETDLIIVDHVHYFDFDDENENRAIKEIAKTVRSLTIEQQKPIILIAHLRKKYNTNDELIAGLDEFHGTSDLYKIATRVITVSPGRITEDGLYETFFRIAKNRLDGGVSRFSAREFFNPKKRGYESGKYQIGWAEQSRKRGFVEIESKFYPNWGRPRTESSASANVPQRQSWFNKD